MIAILDNIRSLHNVGSMFRTADGAGVEKLYLCGITPAPVDEFGRVRPQIAKVSLGAEANVAWEKVDDTVRLLDRLRSEGYRICAVEQAEGSVHISEVELLKYAKIAVVVGSEVLGLSGEILEKADVILELPMYGTKESLNVSVAFGIVVYHLAQILNSKS